MRRVFLMLVLPLVMTLLTACGAKQLAAGEMEGDYTARGTATCKVEDQEYSYPVTVRVATDANGVIVGVADDGTEVTDEYYKKACKLFDKMLGKDRAGVSELDGISQATYSSKAVKEAVDNALADIEVQMSGAG